MIEQNIIWVLTFWLASLLMGLVSLPFTQIFFSSLSDKGYALAKVFGWVIIAYALLVFTTVQILPLSITGILIVVAVWAGLNLFLQIKILKRGAQNPLPTIEIIWTEILFLGLFSFWAFVKGHDPQIYQIERFMDFGFIQALFNARSLPLFDIWMQGRTLNYYYFGHLIAYVLISLTKVPITAGFYLVEAWVFGILGINFYRLGHDIFIFTSKTPKKMAAVVAGIISVFGVLFAGTWHSTAWFISAMQNQLAGLLFPNFWYAEPTRIIPGTITEIPIYTFLVADLHAHMWGLMTGILVLSVLFLIWKVETKVNLKNPLYFLLGFFLGTAYITNTWDIITLGVLSGAVLFFKYFRKSLLDLILLYIEIMLFALIITLPWSIFFRAPLAGIGIVPKQSPIGPWFLFWGALVVPAFIFLIKVLISERKIFPEKTGFLTITIIVTFLFLGFLEIFYFKDILKDGEWFRANTVFKVAMQVWLWLGVVAGPMLIYLISDSRNKIAKLFWSVLVVFLIFSQSIYPLKAVYQANLENKTFSSLDQGLSWWPQKFPDDFAAFLFLKSVRDNLPANDKIRVVLEADGDSYSDTSRFSTFLGWPTVTGWAVHEWTWRGSYDEVGKRAGEVREIYTGKNLEETRQLLQKYNVAYIVIGQVERNKYTEGIVFDKLLQLGRVIFSSGQTEVLQVNKT